MRTLFICIGLAITTILFSQILYSLVEKRDASLNNSAKLIIRLEPTIIRIQIINLRYQIEQQFLLTYLKLKIARTQKIKTWNSETKPKNYKGEVDENY